MSWEKVRLGDVTDSCLGKMLDQHKNKGDLHPYLANINVRWGNFELDNLPQMRFEDSENERYGIQYGDLIVCEGGEPGRCAIWKEQIPNMKIQKALHRIRVHDCLDYRYLYYWFLWAGKRGELEQYFTGSTIKHMPGEKLKSIVIDMPPLNTQRYIASILSAYDDLIENNQKQIKLLEEAAQRLYKEWFVDLRFPGWENTKIVNGVPEGWTRTKLGKILKTFSGSTPSRQNNEYYQGGSIPWLKTKELNDRFILSTEEKITETALKSTSIHIIEKESVIMAMYGATIGKLGISTSALTCNQACCVFDLTVSPLTNEFLFSWLYHKKPYLISLGKGAAQPNLSQEFIQSIDIILPSSIFIEEYTRLTHPFFQSIKNNQEKIEHLSILRNQLLKNLLH